MAVDTFLGRALQDPATGLPNVPYLELIRDWEERQARRHPVVIRTLKITASGGTDRMRRALAWRLIRAVRDTDFIASRGPHYFEVLLTSPDAEHAGALRARLRRTIDEINDRFPDDPPLESHVEVEGRPAVVRRRSPAIARRGTKRERG